jgi:hypothetical protein
LASSPFLHPTAIALGLLIAAMCGGSLVQFLFLRGLRKHYPNQWQHAGRPTIWSDQSLISAWPTIQYLQQNAFCGSSDRAGVAFCQRYRFPMLPGYWLTVATFTAFLALLFTVGWPVQWQ